MDYEQIDTANAMVKKIIKSSFEVFALNDYKKASTNMIVQKVGISRGILYHYFSSKDELFNYLNYYSFAKGFKEVDRHINWENNDIIYRVCEITKYRLDSIAEYPYMIEFSEKYKNRIIEFTNINTLRKWREKFYKHNINFSMFKDSIDIKKALHVIKWTFRGLYKELLTKRENDINNSEIVKLKRECVNYYNLLADNFYKSR